MGYSPRDSIQLRYFAACSTEDVWLRKGKTWFVFFCSTTCSMLLMTFLRSLNPLLDHYFVNKSINTAQRCRVRRRLRKKQSVHISTSVIILTSISVTSTSVLACEVCSVNRSVEVSPPLVHQRVIRGEKTSLYTRAGTGTR